MRDGIYEKLGWVLDHGLPRTDSGVLIPKTSCSRPRGGFRWTRVAQPLTARGQLP
jgi:hypothetical protein